jgi:hypothetical protein
MNRTITALAVGALFFGATASRSEAPQPKTGIEYLQSFKKTNAELLEKQQKTIEALEKMELDAKQLKIFGKRV